MRSAIVPPGVNLCFWCVFVSFLGLRFWTDSTRCHPFPFVCTRYRYGRRNSPKKLVRSDFCIQAFLLLFSHVASRRRKEARNEVRARRRGEEMYRTARRTHQPCRLRASHLNPYYRPMRCLILLALLTARRLSVARAQDPDLGRFSFLFGGEGSPSYVLKP
jgi:hypothetical protein